MGCALQTAGGIATGKVQVLGNWRVCVARAPRITTKSKGCMLIGCCVFGGQLGYICYEGPPKNL